MGQLPRTQTDYSLLNGCFKLQINNEFSSVYTCGAGLMHKVGAIWGEQQELNAEQLLTEKTRKKMEDHLFRAVFFCSVKCRFLIKVL